MATPVKSPLQKRIRGDVGAAEMSDKDDDLRTTEDKTNVSDPSLLGEIGKLLDSKLAPMKDDIAVIKERAVTKLELFQHTKPMQEELESLGRRLANLETQDSSSNVNTSWQGRLSALEAELAKIKALPTCDDQARTAVSGGFAGASSKYQLDTWVSMVLNKVDAPAPRDVYVKGEFAQFKGIAFAKFQNAEDMKLAVDKVRKAGMTYGDTKVWATEDRPMQDRVLQGVLFSCKAMLCAWGNDRLA